MLMQYWQNESSNIIYGFDISDPKQVKAMSQLINVGQWTMLSEVSEFVVSIEQNKQLLASNDPDAVKKLAYINGELAQSYYVAAEAAS